MPVKQISVNLENVPGKLSELSSYLGENGINIIALSVADLADISAIRFVASDPEKAVNVLKSQGYSAKVKEVLALEVPNHPGSLNAVLKPLKAMKINVNDLYTCLERGENTILILGVDQMEKAIHVLKENWIQMVDEELYTL
jgi:hypothetical protein